MSGDVMGFVFLGLVGIWLLVSLIVGIWYLVCSFKADVLLTVLSLFIPFVSLVVVIKYWKKMKGPFLTNVVVGAGGAALFLLLLPMAMPKASAGGTGMAGAPEAGRVESLLGALKSAREGSISVSTMAAGGVKPVGDLSKVHIPSGWQNVDRELPDLVFAVGDPGRGEFATVHTIAEENIQKFAAFDDYALQQVRTHMIEAGDPAQPYVEVDGARRTTSYGLAGRSRMAGDEGKPMSARVTCIEGQAGSYYVVQWRHAAWDEQSRQAFDRIIRSFAEVRVPQAK